MWREGRQVTGGELHLGEAGEGIDDKVPGAFMWREGRQVTGGELHLEEAGERADDKVPGAFMWREGIQVAGEKYLNIFDLSQIIFVISDS